MRVRGQRAVQRVGLVARESLPAARVRRWIERQQDALVDAVEQRVLVRDVVIQRHRLDAERSAEPAHRQSGHAVAIEQRDRCVEDRVAVSGFLRKVA